MVHRTGHTRYLDLYAADPAKWGPVIAGMAAELRENPGPPVNPYIAATRKVEKCPHRSQPETCGCTAGMAICGAGRQEFPDDPRVSFGFCLRCVNERKSTEPTPSSPRAADP